MSDKRDFPDKTWAKLAAGLLQETDVPKYEREMLGDLIVDAVTDQELREKIIERYLELKRLKKRGKLSP
jgi:hypothetical protein